MPTTSGSSALPTYRANIHASHQQPHWHGKPVHDARRQPQRCCDALNTQHTQTLAMKQHSLMNLLFHWQTACLGCSFQQCPQHGLKHCEPVSLGRLGNMVGHTAHTPTKLATCVNSSSATSSKRVVTSSSTSSARAHTQPQCELLCYSQPHIPWASTQLRRRPTKAFITGGTLPQAGHKVAAPVRRAKEEHHERCKLLNVLHSSL